MARESLIDWGNAGPGNTWVEADIECPECNSVKILRSSLFDPEEIKTHSVWCDECGFGFSAKLE